MTQEEMDKLIADAVADSKNESKWHRPNANRQKIETARKCLNWTMMIGTLVTIILYFMFPENKSLWMSVGFASIIIKLVEFFLRFMF